MYPSTPIAAFMSEAGLTPAHILLDFHQRKYAYRILSLPESRLYIDKRNSARLFTIDGWRHPAGRTIRRGLDMG